MTLSQARVYVYQAMRVTGAADPRTPIEDTLEGKLPQRKITQEAAHGYSSYGNQIGLATGLVDEVYHDNYVAKRMEIGAVVGAAPADHVIRKVPEKGDVIILVGGRTGRDGWRRRDRILKRTYGGIHPPVRRRSPERKSSGRAKHPETVPPQRSSDPHQTLQRLRCRRRIRSHRRTG